MGRMKTEWGKRLSRICELCSRDSAGDMEGCVRGRWRALSWREEWHGTYLGDGKKLIRQVMGYSLIVLTPSHSPTPSTS